jgi:hypothetical protein
MTGQLLGIAPERFITAGFGGSGLTETDPELRAKAAADGRKASEGGRSRCRSNGTFPLAGFCRPAHSRCDARSRAAPTPAVDVSKLSIPIIAINGSFDSPYSKTHRLWREARTFQNIILPGKTHLTAIAVGGPMPPQYIDSIGQIHRQLRRAMKPRLALSVVLAVGLQTTVTKQTNERPAISLRDG